MLHDTLKAFGHIHTGYMYLLNRMLAIFQLSKYALLFFRLTSINVTRSVNVHICIYNYTRVIFMSPPQSYAYSHNFHTNSTPI